MSETAEASRPTRRRAGITQDLAWTALASTVLILGNVLLAYMLARRGAADVFGPYNLAKRVGAAMMPALALGLHIGAVRFIAGTSDEQERRRYEVATAGLVAAVLALGTLVIAALPQQVSSLLLGTVDTSLLWATWAYTCALVVNAIVYALYRAEMRHSLANWNNLFVLIIVPVAVVAIAPDSWVAEPLLLLVAGLGLAWNGVQVAWRVGIALRIKDTVGHLRDSAVRMLAFSLPRVPAGVSDAAIAALPPLIATRGGEPLAASYILAGLSFMTVIAAELQTFAVVLLPRVSEMAAEGRVEVISDICSRLLYIVAAVSAFSIPLLYAFSTDVVALWLGSEFLPAVPVVRVALVSIPAVLIYNAYKSVLDGALKAPINTYASVAGIGLCFVLAVLPDPGDAVALTVTFAVGKAVTAAIVFAVVFVKFRPVLHLPALAVMTAAGLGVTLLVWVVTPGGEGTAPALVRLGSAALAGGVGIIAALWYSPSDLRFRRSLAGLFRRNRA